MNRMMAAAFFGIVVLCGAPALARDIDAIGSTSMTNPQAVHKKLMKDCVDQEKSGSSLGEVRRSCQAKVKDEMQQMNDAGTLPATSEPALGVRAPQ
jgi:hypothetical protein